MLTTRATWIASVTVGVALLTGMAVPAFGQAYWRFEEASGGMVLDSGQNGLDGTLDALPFRTTDVAVDPVPLYGFANAQSLNLNWQSTSSGGFFTVPDMGGALTMGNQDFTIEAWVKLDHLSSTSSNDERQFLCQKKPLPSQDGQIDYAFLVQRGNHSNPSPNYGKTSGFSGRELQVYFGTGASTSTWGATSHLEINDLNWHFVSVAYDTGNNVIRFGIDSQFETISFSDNPHNINSGPLRVGSHQNGSGVDNFFLRGTIDEMRVSHHFLPPEHLLSAPAQDCNGNGIPDVLDLSDGTSGDCNGNLTPDECDISEGTSEDCQPDGVPDECQLTPFLYALDDGESDISVQSEGDYMAWLSQFTVVGDFGTITDIDISFSSTALGEPVTLYLWSDPDGDGNPTDATVLTSWSLTIEPGMDNPDALSRIDVPDTFVGIEGTSFFVGAILDVPSGGSIYPAAADWDEPTTPGRSWLVGANAPLDPNDLTADAVEFGLFEDLLPPGNWCVRAVAFYSGGVGDCNGNGVPDDCDIAEGTSQDSNGNGVPDECELAGTFYVPDSFGTIQAAIATALEGSTIIVRSGTYPENLDFLGKTLEVRSEFGQDVTTIDGGGNGSVVVFQNGEGPDSILAGFTLTGGSGESGLGGGGVLCWGSSPTIRDNTIAANSTNDYGGGILVYGAATPVIRGNRIEGNFADASGGAIYAQLDNTTVHIQGNQIVDNTAGSGFGSGVACVNGTLVLLGNEISGNVGAESGGGVFVIYSGEGQHRIESNEIRANQATDDGGGLWFSNAADIVIASNLFEGNSSPNGGGIYARGSGTIMNCTIAGNAAGSQGGGLLYDDSGGALVILNSIIRDNLAPTTPDIEYPDGGSSISYSSITGGWPGTGNIDADPLFFDVPGSNYRLGVGSPCINAGDPGDLPAADEKDLDGHSRVLCSRVEMGAYEFGIGDYNCNQVIDLSDFASWPDCMTGPEGGSYGAGCEAFDFEFDGDVDMLDFDQFQQIFSGP